MFSCQRAESVSGAAGQGVHDAARTACLNVSVAISCEPLRGRDASYPARTHHDTSSVSNADGQGPCASASTGNDRGPVGGSAARASGLRSFLLPGDRRVRGHARPPTVNRPAGGPHWSRPDVGVSLPLDHLAVPGRVAPSRPGSFRRRGRRPTAVRAEGQVELLVDDERRVFPSPCISPVFAPDAVGQHPVCSGRGDTGASGHGRRVRATDGC